MSYDDDDDDDRILDDGAPGLRRGGGLSPQTSAALRAAALWSRRYLYLVAASVLVGLVSNTVSAATIPGGAALLPATLFGYLMVAGLLGYPAYQFYRFATLPDAGREGESIVALGSTLKYVGILTALVFGTYGLLLALGIAIAVGASLLA